MAKVKEMTADDLEQLIEHKVVEMLGDPDAGLRLKPEFRKKLESRLKQNGLRTCHQEVIKRFG
jgi:hypothetical protein